jgi:hypothetical protein
MRLAAEADLKAALLGLGFSGRLNTALIERAPLTVRHGVAALARRTWATSQQTPHLLAHLEWWRAYYHGCRVPMLRYECLSCSHKSEGANVWRNAIDSVPQPWQWREPTGDGRHARYSRAPCHRFALERHRSQVWLERHIAMLTVKGQQKKSDVVSLPGKMACPDCPLTKKPARRGFAEAHRIIHH